MLFDLEDYRSAGIIGPDNKPANQINWVNPYTTFRATRDAYLKAVNEYFLASQVMCTPEEAQTLNVKYLAFSESNLTLGPLSKEFWQAMVSLPIAGQLTIGDRFDVSDVNKYAEDSSYIVYPDSMNQSWWTENYKSVAKSNLEGEYVFTEMSQQLYDDYKEAFADFQSKVKEIITIAEGIESFDDYVAPAVPAWDSYPELSGYVRGTNNLTIKNAVVRLIDADGVNHDLVTDDNGYYKFDKEMFYNNIAFDPSVDLLNFNMFLLENIVGSTASLYNKTSKFENSFWGAENNREVNWEISLKMGKPGRKNFKIEVIENYSDYPSIKGHVKDQNGNAVKGALVALFYMDGGQWLDADYNKNTGSWRRNTKISLFGEDKSLLTDENGYYEYPSQFIGEWFNENFLVSNPEWSNKINEELYNTTNGYSINNEFSKYNDGDDKGFDNYSNEWVYAIAEQADGKFLVGGNLRYSYEGTNVNRLIRLNTDGTLDDTFTPQFSRRNGDVYYTEAYVSSIEVQADGKILVAGAFDYINDVEVHNIARLNSDGTLDETFVESVFGPIYDVNDINYISYYNLERPMLSANYPDMYVNTMKLQEDGKIIVGGYFYIPQINSYGIVRFNSDGSLDQTFMNHNDLLPSKDSLVLLVNDVKLKQKNGHVKEVEKDALQPEYDRLNDLVNLANDYLGSLSESDPGYADAQLDYDTKSADFQSFKDNIFTPAIVASDNAWDDLSVAITTRDQAVNNFFTPLSGSNFIGQRFGGLGEDPRVIKLQSDGKILIGGSEWMNFGGYVRSINENGDTVDSPFDLNFGLIRLNSDGTLDTTLSVGTSFCNLGNHSNYTYIKDILVQSDGKIIVVGRLNHFGELTTIVNKSIRNLIRLNSDGTLDTTFDTTSPSDDEINNIFESSDGFFISGQFGMSSYKSNGDTYSSYLYANGQVQRSFKTSDDSILVFGNFNTVCDETGTNYSVQGMVKLNFGEMRFVNESKKTFDSSGYISYNEGTLENKTVRLNTNDFRVVLLPYIQDQINGIVTTPYDVNYQNTPVVDRIYDYTDWFNSKFSYAWNERDEIYINTIEIGENVIDVQEVIVDPEVGAEKVYISMEKRDGWDAILFSSTTGYIRLVDELGNKYWPSNGSWFDFNGYVEIGDSRDYYAYSCNSLGGAEGKITTINLSGNVDINIDELTNLQYFNSSDNSKITTINFTSSKDTLVNIYVSDNYYLQSMNISGCSLLSDIYVSSCKRLKNITGIQNLSSLTNLTINYSPVSTNSQSIVGEFMYEIDESTRTKYLSSKYRVDGEVKGVAELPDGSSVYVGTFNWAYYFDSSVNQDLQYYAQKIVKFKADGTIDENFMNNIGNGFNSTPYGIELLSDGKLLIYGDFDYFKNKETGSIIKLSSTGVLDTSFITKIKDKVLSIRDLLILEDGSMLISSGNSYQGATTTGWDYRGIYKLKANGDLDTDFKMYLNNTSMRIKKLGDSFFAVGYFDTVNTPNSNVNGARIAKFDINGNIDSVFMNNTVECRPYSSQTVWDIEMDSSSNIIICGDFDSLQKRNGNVISMGTRLARYDSTGLFDQNLYDSLCVNGNPIYVNGSITSISIQGDKTVMYGSFNQINNVDQGQKRYLTIDSNGLDKGYISELGSPDSSVYKIIKKENYTYLLGYWWTYYGSNGVQYDTTPMMVKLVKTPKVISTLVVPSTTNNLYLRLDRLFANLDISNAKISNAYIYTTPVSTLDFSNSPNINQIEINDCKNLTNLVIGNPSNLQGLFINGCPSVDISTIDLSLIKYTLSLNYVDLGTNDLVIDAPYIRNIRLNRVKANSISIDAPILNNEIYMEYCTFNNVSIDAPQMNSFYQRGDLPGLDYSSFSGIQTLNLNEMSSLPDLSVFTNLRNLYINRLQWSSLTVNSSTLIYLDITSWNGQNQNISINTPELTYMKVYGFYQKPNFESIIAPKLFTLSLDWCNQPIQTLTFEKFTMIKRLEIQNYMELRGLDLSTLTSLQQFQINWANRLSSLIMPSGTTNSIREFRISYSPWDSSITTAQRTAIIGNSLEGLAKSTWNGGYAYFYSDRTWQLDATAISNKTTLRNNKGWNIQGNLSN